MKRIFKRKLEKDFEDKMTAPILSIIPFKVFIELLVVWIVCVVYNYTFPSPF